MSDAKMAAEVVRLYQSDTTMSVRHVARLIHHPAGFGAGIQFVRRVLRSRGIAIRPVERIAAKARRNEELRTKAATGATKTSLAREHRISRQRVSQIVRGV